MRIKSLLAIALIAIAWPVMRSLPFAMLFTFAATGSFAFQQATLGAEPGHLVSIILLAGVPFVAALHQFQTRRPRVAALVGLGVLLAFAVAVRFELIVFALVCGGLALARVMASDAAVDAAGARTVAWVL